MLHVAFKVILRLVLALLSVVGFFIRPFLILYAYICTPKRKLPPFRDALLEIPAVDLAEKIRNREVIKGDLLLILSIDQFEARMESECVLWVIERLNPLHCSTLFCALGG